MAPNFILSATRSAIIFNKEEAGLTWNSRVSRLGVNPHRLREWRRDTEADSTNLFIRLTLAEKLRLRGILICPEKDMGDEAVP